MNDDQIDDDNDDDVGDDGDDGDRATERRDYFSPRQAQ